MRYIRKDSRALDKLRPITLQYDFIGYSNSSVFFAIGKTKVLISVTLQSNVPPFLKGQKTGWLNAEYAMLPCATQQRTNREAIQQKRNSRNVEISRLISRCLRLTVNLDAIPEKTIIVDCDVLQADGGTRVACITAASLALERAAKYWFDKKITSQLIFKEHVAAVSVGIIEGVHVLDLNFDEDSRAESDFNFVMTRSGDIVEIQGTAEKTPLSWIQFEQLKTLAQQGVVEIFEHVHTSVSTPSLSHAATDVKSQNKLTHESDNAQNHNKQQHSAKNGTGGLFSLGNRLGNVYPGNTTE